MQNAWVKDIFFVIVLLMLIYEIRSFWLGKLSQSWRKHQAKVLDVYVNVRDDEDTQQACPKVKYTYHISGRKFISSKLAYGYLWSYNFANAITHVKGINVGKEIEIYINPKKPQQSVVITGYVGNFVLRFVILVVILVVLSVI